MTVIIRDHENVQTWSNCDEYLAQDIFLGGKHAADTFGTVTYTDGNRWAGNCPEHADSLVYCFEGTVSI